MGFGSVSCYLSFILGQIAFRVYGGRAAGAGGGDGLPVGCGPPSRRRRRCRGHWWPWWVGDLQVALVHGSWVVYNEGWNRPRLGALADAVSEAQPIQVYEVSILSEELG